MTHSTKLAVIFTPTQHEFSACQKRLEQVHLDGWTTRCIKTGPGKANAAFHTASLKGMGLEPHVLIGAGTSGALQHGLRQGEIIASAHATVADWKMIHDDGESYANYGELNYAHDMLERHADLHIACDDPKVTSLLAKLHTNGFRQGAMLTSDMFIAGERHKLDYGKRFGCLACDMESGVFGYLANRYLACPWLNIRVVADTIGESFEDYAAIEPQMTKILAEHLEEVMRQIAESW